MNDFLFILMGALFILSIINQMLMHYLLKSLNQELFLTSRMAINNDIMLRALQDALVEEKLKNDR